MEQLRSDDRKAAAQVYVKQLEEAAAHWGVEFDLEYELGTLGSLSDSDRRELLAELSPGHGEAR
jgi:hypothetical protein